MNVACDPDAAANNACTNGDLCVRLDDVHTDLPGMRQAPTRAASRTTWCVNALGARPDASVVWWYRRLYKRCLRKPGVPTDHAGGAIISLRRM